MGLVKKISRLPKVLLFVILVLVVIRAVLPIVVRDFANEKLKNAPGFAGHIADIDLHIWRGAVEIEEIVIRKREGQETYPFFKSPWVHASIQWTEVFRGALVIESEIYKPEINLVLAKKAEEDQTEVPKDFRKYIADLMPIKINRFKVTDGKIYFRNLRSEPNINLFVNDLNVTATNLRNTRKKDKELYATTDVSAKLMDDAKFSLKLKADPFEDPMEFDMESKLTGLELKKLNSFFKAYGDFDVETGTADLFTEVAAKGGKILGYVKPMMKNVDVVRWKKDKKDGLFQVLWEAVVGTAGEVLENQPRDQAAAKIPIEGSMNRPGIDIWEAMSSILTHAFFKAMIPGIEKTIDFKEVDKKVDKDKRAEGDKKPAG
jgi:hypothetical protein